jgi:hypothetical protein
VITSRKLKHVARFGPLEAKERGYQEYVDFVEGTTGESDEGLYSAVPYQPEGFTALGDGNYRRSQHPTHY